MDFKLVQEIPPSFAVSFSCRRVIDRKTVDALDCDIVNVHCLVLSWNRGDSPYFFNCLHNTPKGVTVHRITANLDCDDILLQRELPLMEEETFSSSYEKLLLCADDLMRDNWDALVNGLIYESPQPFGGSYNTIAVFYAAKS